MKSRLTSQPIFFLLMIFLLFQFRCMAQAEKVKYYKADNSASDSMHANYYKVGKYRISWLDSVKGYYSKNNVRKSVEFYTTKGREGVCTYFDANGVLSKKLTFEGGHMETEQQFNLAGNLIRQIDFHEDGSEEELQFYLNGAKKVLLVKLDSGKFKHAVPLIKQAWDSLATQTVQDYQGYLKNGSEEGKVRNGLKDSTWIAYSLSGQKSVIEKYNNGKFIEGERLDRSPTIHYRQIDESASPVEGLQDLYAEISSDIFYPIDARKRGIEGKVYVKFVVEPNGSISSVEVVKGVFPSIDDEAIRVVKALSNWNPGKHRGLPVRQPFTLPIAFKLK